jgi:hypothetical protein
VEAVLRARAIGDETLVAETGGDTLGAEERDEQVRFCIAEPDAHAQDLAGSQGDARVLDVNRVCDVISDPLVGSARESFIIGTRATHVACESDDRRRSSLDNGVAAEVVGGVTGAELQCALP